MISARSVVLLLLIPVLGKGQSLDSLMREAAQHNQQLQSYQYRIESASARADAASALPPPTVGAELSQVPVSSRSPFADAISQNLSVSQMFMLGGKLSAMSEAERKRTEVLEQNRGAAAADLRGRVAMNYINLWLLERQVKVKESGIAALDDLVRTMAARVTTNRMRQADLLMVQAELSSSRAALFGLRSRQSTARNALAALLGRRIEAAPPVPDSSGCFDGVVVEERALVDRFLQENPSLQGMDRMREMNELDAVAARKELIPDLMVQAMAMRMPNGMLLTSGSRSMEAIQESAMGMPMQKPEWMYSVMVSVTLPFLPWSSGRSTAKAEELRLANLGIASEREAMKLEMLGALRSGIERYHLADSLVVQYDSTILPLLREAVEAQTVAYMTGQTSISTVLDARRMELMKQDEYLMALADRRMALVEMEMMVGVPLH
jgi:outer membrane protein TolC